MIKIVLTNDIVKRISAIDENRFKMNTIHIPHRIADHLRKISKKKSSYASNKIEGKGAGLRALFRGKHYGCHEKSGIHRYRRGLFGRGRGRRAHRRFCRLCVRRAARRGVPRSYSEGAEVRGLRQGA